MISALLSGCGGGDSSSSSANPDPTPTPTPTPTPVAKAYHAKVENVTVAVPGTIQVDPQGNNADQHAAIYEAILQIPQNNMLKSAGNDISVPVGKAIILPQDVSYDDVKSDSYMSYCDQIQNLDETTSECILRLKIKVPKENKGYTLNVQAQDTQGDIYVLVSQNINVAADLNQLPYIAVVKKELKDANGKSEIIPQFIATFNGKDDAYADDDENINNLQIKLIDDVDSSRNTTFDNLKQLNRDIELAESLKNMFPSSVSFIELVIAYMFYGQDVKEILQNGAQIEKEIQSIHIQFSGANLKDSDIKVSNIVI